MTAWSLLSGADPFFAEVADQVGAGFSAGFSPQTLLTVILSLPVGAWLFGLAGGSLYQAEPGPSRFGRWQTALDRMQVLPGFTTALVIGVLCGIYSLFFAVEAYAYLTQLIAGAITVTLACAVTPLQGFWQLCGIVLLNLSVLAVLHTLSETFPARSRPPAFAGEAVKRLYDRVCPVSRIKARRVRVSLRLDAAPGAGGLGLERVGGRRRSGLGTLETDHPGRPLGNSVRLDQLHAAGLFPVRKLDRLSALRGNPDPLEK